jgi:hypothetical protein
MTSQIEESDDLTVLVVEAGEVMAFFSNGGKKERERWVLDHWLASTGRLLTNLEEGERPDFTVDGVGIEVVEVLEPERRRCDEYRADKDSIAQGGSALWKDSVDSEAVRSKAHEWICNCVSKKAEKYGQLATGWILLIYANYSWWQHTEWQAVRDNVAREVVCFSEIVALGADGEMVINIKP